MSRAPGTVLESVVEGEHMAETLVLGLGNILLGDEGVGVRVIERLLE
jgi:hypothetical protein